ncbi:DUF3329 domain-containing protein [Clostridium sp. LP20]|uniref:DUF3329 domain-containing protein n=1 Tax=Clostridium sp. LP20 TaxID=3418665 RepID=UPI003EE714D2
MKKRRTNEVMPIILLGIMLFSIFLLSYVQPMYADDYNYAFIFGTNDRIDSFADIFKSLNIFYNNWGGRMISMILSHLFLWGGRWIFAVCNTGVFFLFCFVIYKCTLGIYDEKNDFFKVWLVHMLILFGVPIVSETVLWEVGSFNYLWLMTLSMLYIYPYLLEFFGKKKINDNIKNCIWISLIGFLAGMTNENVVPILIGANLIYIIYYKIMNNKIQIWSVLGLISSSIGAMILMFAPGNSVRAEVEYSAYNIPKDIGVKFSENYLPVLKTVIKQEYLIIGILFFIALAMYIKIYGHKNKEVFISLLLMLSAIISNAIMIYPSTYYARSSFGGGIFIILGICILGSRLYCIIDKYKVIYRSIILLGVILIGLQVTPSLRNGVEYNKDYTELVNYVEAEKVKGNLEIETNSISYSKRKFLSGMDLSNDKNYV